MRMQRIVVSVAILLGLVAAGCDRHRQDEVVAIGKTRSYHTDQCPRVNMARTAMMTRTSARALDYRPCPGCKPDRSMVDRSYTE